jgi:hypothetical protein
MNLIMGAALLVNTASAHKPSAIRFDELTCVAHSNDKSHASVSRAF